VKRSHLGAMLFCILFTCSFAFGQSATTSLRGTVKDPSGALVPNATVTLSDAATDKTLVAVSNSAGYYQFAQIPPAKYTIVVTASGFGSESKSAELLVNQPATIDFALSMQANTVTVDVSAAAQTLNLTDATIGNSVGNETIQALPMEGRDPISLLSLQPGVLYIGSETTDSRNGAVAGGRSDQGNVSLDGIDDNDQINGSAFTGILRSTLDSTEEFRVTTSNGTAEAGRSSGAQVNLITKAGTNKVHGALYEYYRPTNTVANNFFNKNNQLASNEANVPQKYVQNVFGGSVGGPIKKDKLFYFFNYEGKRQAVDQIVEATTPFASFLSGQLGYLTDSGATQYLTPAQVSTLDKPCMSNTYNGAPVCPWGAGPDPNILSYFGTEPAATGSAAGDGINSGSYFFPSSAPLTQNTSIVKLDYDLNNKNHIFARGNLQKDTTAGNANLPGQPPSTLTEDNTKGFALGYTLTITPNMINDLRYGYIRQGYGISGLGTGDYVDIRAFTQPTAQTRNTKVNVPVQTILDTLSWTKSTHTLNFGGGWRGIQNNRGTDANSYSNATTNPYWFNTIPPPDPNAVLGLPSVGGNFANSYEIAYATLVGTVPQLNDVINYKVSGPTTGTLLADGAFINRSFHANEFEYYLQDSWRIRPNLTVTYGLRHTILQTPYESNGQQVAPTVDTRKWFLNRGAAAAQGQVSEDLLLFAPNGKANDRPAYWPKQKANFAPRLSVVYSPKPRMSIRAGAGIYFDHYGEGLVNSFDQEGSFGLSTTLTNPAGEQGFETGPRFTGPHNLPNISLPAASATQTFPYNVPSLFGIDWGLDNHLKTPYSESFDLSIQTELGKGWTLEEAYVGRLGRHLLQQLDLAEPVNFNDPQGGGTYFAAASQLSKIADQQGGNPCAVVPKITYFEDVFSYMAGFNPSVEADGVTPNPCPTPNASATQAVYTYEWAANRYVAGETTSLADLDEFCYNGAFGVSYNCPAQSRFWQQQFSSLYAWSTIGTSSYNALQFTLRHPSSHGLTTDVSYTFAKSLDMNSGTERNNELSAATASGATQDNGFTDSAIQNSWNPKANKAVSDYDTHSLITADWVYALPVGRGKAFLAGANHLTDALIGGWQWAGLGRWTSGLPFSFNEPGWSTDWQLEGYGVKTGTVQLKKTLINGLPQILANPAAVGGGIYNGTPIRLPYPGEAGERNGFRGDGYFDIDSSLTKNWEITEHARLKFAWEV